MYKKKFNIKYRPFIENRICSVITRSRKPVRIICWDKESSFPVVGLIDNDKDESICTFNIDGKVSNETDSEFDLFIVTEDGKAIDNELEKIERSIEDISSSLGNEGFEDPDLKKDFMDEFRWVKSLLNITDSNQERLAIEFAEHFARWGADNADRFGNIIWEPIVSQ